jgi:hypothetical protein
MVPHSCPALATMKFVMLLHGNTPSHTRLTALLQRIESQPKHVSAISHIHCMQIPLQNITISHHHRHTTLAHLTPADPSNPIDTHRDPPSYQLWPLLQRCVPFRHPFPTYPTHRSSKHSRRGIAGQTKSCEDLG